MVFNGKLSPSTYTCAQCGHRSTHPEEFRRVHPRTIFNECVDRRSCDLRTASCEDRLTKGLVRVPPAGRSSRT